MPIPYLHVPCLWSSSALTLMADSSLRGFSSSVVIRLSVVMFVFNDPDALVYSYLHAKYIQRQGHGDQGRCRRKARYHIAVVCRQGWC